MRGSPRGGGGGSTRRTAAQTRVAQIFPEVGVGCGGRPVPCGYPSPQGLLHHGLGDVLIPYHLCSLEDGGEVPVKALINRPCRIARRPLGVGELPAKDAALLLGGPYAEPLPHQFPVDRGVVPPHSRGLPPRGANPPGPAAAPACGVRARPTGPSMWPVFPPQVTFQVLNAVDIPPRGAEALVQRGVSACTQAPRAATVPRGSSEGAASGGPPGKAPGGTGRPAPALRVSPASGPPGGKGPLSRPVRADPRGA